MKILLVCHRFPYPPNEGGKIRSFHIVKHLHSQGHEVTVAGLARSKREVEAAANIEDYCSHYALERVGPVSANIRMLLRLPSPVASSMGYFFSPRLAERINRLVALSKFDLIVAHSSSVTQYVEHLSTVPKLLDFVDMDSQKWLSYAEERRFPLSTGYLIEGRKLERAEIEMARHFDLCTCATRAELDTLNSFGVETATGSFPNGVDTDYFSPTGEPYDPNTICFLGRMDYYPNEQAMVHFCADVFPLIRTLHPAAELLIVGAKPTRRIRRLAQLPGVSVTGAVPDVRPYLRRAALSVAPLKIARGTQNKVLESMAMGVPVVASPRAAAGVDALANEHLLTASTPSDYAQAVSRLMTDATERSRLATSGRLRMLSHHSWSRSMARFDALMEECILRFRARQAAQDSDSTLRGEAVAPREYGHSLRP